MSVTIQEFHRRFKTSEQCLEYLFRSRFNVVECPFCGRKNAYHRHPTKPCYTCNCGRSHIYPMKHSIFENSSVPLAKWFYAIFLMMQTKEGVSAKKLERDLQVTYPTAWRMAKLIRSVRPDDSQWGKPIFLDLFLQSCMFLDVLPLQGIPTEIKKVSVRSKKTVS